MDDDKLADRVESLENLIADRFLQDREAWLAVHARISACEVAFEILANAAQKRHPLLARELVDGLSFTEREARRLNYHDAFLRQVRSLRDKLAEQLDDLVASR